MSPARRKFLRPWLILPLAVIVGVGAWLILKPKPNSAASATPTTTDRLEAVTTGTMQQTVSTTGTIEPQSTEDLTFSAAGTVTAVDVQAGQTVTAGQTLATIDSASLQVAVSQATATVDSAQAKLSDDEAADASADQIDADYTSLVSDNAALTTANTNLAGASLTSPIAGQVAEVNLTVGEQLGSSGSAGTSLTGTGTGSGRSSSSLGSGSSGGGASAIAAALGGSSSSSSSSSSSGDIEVISTGVYSVTVGIDTTQIKQIKVGQTANVTPTTSNSTGGGFGGGGGGGFARFLAGGFGGFGGGGGTGTGGGGTTATTTPTSVGTATTGLVTSVGAIASSSTGVATFPVVVTVLGDPTGFNAGAGATVDIVYNELKNVVEVPSFAITQNGTTSTVTVEATNGKKSTQTVTTGLVANGETQILTGLKDGQNVVIAIPSGISSRLRSFTGAGGAGGTGGAGGFGGFGRGGAGATGAGG